MKRILILCNLFLAYHAFAQFGQGHVISNEVDPALTFYAVDLDGDFDIDVISCTQFPGEICWHENIDGMGNFSPKQIISTEAGPLTVLCADLDSDGDMDVLSSSSYPPNNKIAWYENTDGQGSFGEIQIIETEVGGVTVHAADIDGDSDMDVLFRGSTNEGNGIVWVENIDGLGNFGTPNLITTNINGLMCIYAVDLDNDDDIDVISASRLDDKIAWYRNEDGLGTFSTQYLISSNAEKVASVFSADIDSDGDMDVLSAADKTIAWYENINGIGDFSDEKIIDSFAYGARSVFAADLDNDSDIDVTAAADSSHELVWYENLNGIGDFSDEHIITTDVLTPTYVFVSDIDGDNDNDIILSDDTGNRITWHENLTDLSVNQNDVLIFDVYPNPTYGIIKTNTTIDQMKIYNNLGQLVLSNSGKNEIDMTNINPGLYIVKIIGSEGNLSFRRVIKN